MAYPPVGHLDPQFLTLMNEVQDLLRFVFETQNPLTIPVSGTGSAGMEAAFANFVEPGDSALICVNGYFGERMVEIAGRYGATVHRLDRPWGEVFTLDEIDDALSKEPAKLVALVHAETSTGALQPLDGLAEVVHRHGALLIVDCVTSLGGVPVQVDAQEIDVVYSGTQKCVGAPPGLAPLTIGPAAREVLEKRKTKVANWYLDLSIVSQYWGAARTYHHTAPINMNYALREALRMAQEEGLEARFARHRANAGLLWAGLEDLDLDLHVAHEYRLPTLTTVRVPVGVDDLAVRKTLLDDYNVEIGGGLGVLKGKVWRVGLMGYSSSRENVTLLLGALRAILGR
jgi:alanine-glyoxylate transaminase/serine-glyoxylate transaminase/serine-pyruvate transaminase